jgi:glucose/arabinose dehydrogenase
LKDAHAFCSLSPRIAIVTAAALFGGCSDAPENSTCAPLGSGATASAKCVPEAGTGRDGSLQDRETPPDATTVDVSDDGGPAEDTAVPEVGPPPAGAYCALPGSVVWTAQGPSVVQGGPPSATDLTWLTLPPGFCAHYFGTVGDARQLRFAPGGELFVASPTTGTTGGNPAGAIAGIVVLPDDNHDGLADSNITFLNGLPSIQGLLFANGSLYYQDGTNIRTVAYRAGDRQPSATSRLVTTFTDAVVPQAPEHWPKVMDIAKDGTIYVSNGGSQSDVCSRGAPARGAIFTLQPDGGTSLVARGFRNPIALRCEADHDVCVAVELALDYSDIMGGREKLVPIRPGDDWGYPCCATHNAPYSNVNYAGGGTPDCSGVATDTDSFVIAHTPFGLDFETGAWPAPWGGRVFVTLHGVVGSWQGARVVAIGVDPTTGMPLPATELDGGGPKPDSMLEFATGWDDSKNDHGRPAPVTFAPDGRMFLGNDNNGDIVWIAPVNLMRK